MEQTMTNDLPVTLKELKDHLHITSDDFDTSLQNDLNAAIAAAQAFTSIDIRQRVVPVSVPFVKTITCPENARIENMMVDGKEIDYQIVNNIIYVGVDSGERISYSVVYGYTSDNCPEDIKMAILLTAARYFNNPVDSVEQLPKASTALLRTHKRYMI